MPAACSWPKMDATFRTPLTCTWSTRASGSALTTNTAQAGFPREGIEFCGVQGHLRIDRTKFEYFSPERGAAPLVVECRTDLVAEHVQDFLDSCRTRKLPKGDVALGHRSAQAAHLGNLSYEQKRRIHFDPDREIVLPAS